MRVKLYLSLVFFLLLSFAAQSQSSNLLAMGYQKLEARELNEAISLFSQVLRESPRDTAALSGIIRANLLAENLKDAQRYIDIGIKEHPNNPEFYLHRGILNNMRGQYRRAVADFTKALEYSSGSRDVQIYINRGIAHMQDDNYGDAIADFTDALEINPRNGSALSSRSEERRVRKECR